MCESVVVWRCGEGIWRIEILISIWIWILILILSSLLVLISIGESKSGEIFVAFLCTVSSGGRVEAVVRLLGLMHGCAFSGLGFLVWANGCLCRGRGQVLEGFGLGTWDLSLVQLETRTKD